MSPPHSSLSVLRNQEKQVLSFPDGNATSSFQTVCSVDDSLNVFSPACQHGFLFRESLVSPVRYLACHTQNSLPPGKTCPEVCSPALCSALLSHVNHFSGASTKPQNPLSIVIFWGKALIHSQSCAFALTAILQMARRRSGCETYTSRGKRWPQTLVLSSPFFVM